jgi:hypothetical protein
MMYMVNKNIESATGRAIAHNFERSAVATIAKSKANTSKKAHRHPGSLTTHANPGSLKRDAVGK